VLVLAAVAAFLGRQRRLTPAAILALAALLLVPYAKVLALRRQLRYTYYESAAKRELYDMHPLHPDAILCWPVWRALDEVDGATVAATAGWDGIGHNWYRYPLLGSRLQNRVVYIPVTGDGSVVDYRRAEVLADRADFRAWVDRLVAQRVDYVAVLPPDPLEGRWIQSSPELFSLVERGPGGLCALYRFNR
jgi:hypothetical protein